MDTQDFVRKDVYRAEQENIVGLIKDTRDRLEDYKDTTGRQLTFWGITIGVIAFLFAAMQIGIALLLYLVTKG